MFMDAEKMNLFFRRKIKYLEKVKFGLYIVKLVNLSAVNSKVINEFSFCCLLFFIFLRGLIRIISLEVNALRETFISHV